jgi:hypothetical protein
MGLTRTTPATATPNLAAVQQTIDPDDVAFCNECCAVYPLQRRALGYKTCLSCGEQDARQIAQRNNVAGASSQPRHRQPATSPLANTCDTAHTVSEYRTKHVDLYEYMRTGTTRKTI